MKKLVILFTALLLFACNNTQKEAQKENASEATTTYSVDPASVEFKWVAYKTSDKIAVPGTFDNIKIEVSEGRDIPALLTSVSFTIDGTSINSGNPERDEKLRKFFVGNWTDSTITGSTETVTGDNEKGQGKFKLNWNGLNKTLDFNYTVNNDTLKIISEIIMPDWNAGDAAKALNTACKDVHTGKDGKSVLWDNVMIEIKAPVKTTNSTMQDLKEGTEAVKTIMK